MKNAFQDGRVLDVTLPAATASGAVVVKGGILGVAVTNGAAGDTIAVHVEGVFRLPKLVGAAIEQGDWVTWDINPGRVIVASPAAGDIESFGYATEDAANGTDEVLVRLCPGSGVPFVAG